MKKIKLLVADDHKILLEGIVSLLQSDNSFEVVAVAENGNDVLQLLSKNKVDVCLLDINMPGMDGIATAKQITQQQLPVKVIMLTTYNDKEIITELLHTGVAGYVLKNAGRQELVAAIKKVAEGGNFFSAEIADIIINGLDEQKQTAAILLTEREKEIVQLLAQEFTNDKIASQLHISYRTVETHRKNIMQKTGAHNLAGLLRYAFAEKLI
jgi:DNA-binding NarL/FixJ family response regulator